VLFFVARKAAGAAVAPAFPAPSVSEGKAKAKLGRNGRREAFGACARPEKFFEINQMIWFRDERNQIVK
jgi:hypothetical protein